MSHGKNACDGVGGTLIGLAAHASLQRPFSEQILSIKQLCKFANSEITSVTTLFVNLQYVQENIPLTAGFQIAAPSREITRIMSLFHCYEPCVCSCFQKFTYPTKRKCFVYWAHYVWIILCLFLWWWVVLWCCKLCFIRKLWCEH